MSKIYIRSYAYNAEKTLRRAVDSVLNQTHSDFIYYLCDNGSTDGTRKIVEEYAVRDSRIKAFYNAINQNHQETQECLHLPQNIDNNDFFCTLDSDDEYLSTFFEEMLAFINEYDLDIAACGSDFMSVADNNKLVGQRILTQNLILQGNDFSEYFTIYHQFMRTIWGKLYKGWTLRNSSQDSNAPGYPRAYGGDTYNTMRAFRDAKRVGILARSLHKYYVSAKSVSYAMHPERVRSDQILHKATLDFLKTHGTIDSRNEKFLYLVYFNAVKDTLNVVMNAQISSLEKMRSIQDIFTCKYTQELLRHNFASIDTEANKLRDAVSKWILTQKECRKENNAGIAAEILMDMYEGLPQMISQDGLKYIISRMPEIVEYVRQRDYNRILERIRTWFKRHDADISVLTELEIFAYRASGKLDDEILMLFINIKKNRPQASKALDIDAQIYKVIEKYPLLKNMSVNLMGSFKSSVRWVIKGKYAQALHAFISIKDTEISDNDAESYIMFGQNLSAAADCAESYIFFRKLQIYFLIDHGRINEARVEMDELEELLPHDNEIFILRRQLNSVDNIILGDKAND